MNILLTFSPFNFISAFILFIGFFFVDKDFIKLFVIWLMRISSF
uniref:Uncharacterized protein n=1 Tax=Siphoviridae sp. ct4be24 TaxID=2826289 RepID=A0A8S5QS18_9CAUD|nr:MAG TPA: hypothetical protein [Siphoviridae sp. ct4be24]